MSAALALVSVVSPEQSKSAPQVPGTGASQHSAAVGSIWFAVTVSLALSCVFPSDCVEQSTREQSKAAPQVPGTGGCSQHSAAVPIVSAVTVSKGLFLVFVASPPQ